LAGWQPGGGEPPTWDLHSKWVFLDVYIARLDDTQIDPSNPNAGLKTLPAWSDCFPGGRSAYDALHAAVNDGEWNAIQTDWGAIVVPHDKMAIRSLVDRIYTPEIESRLADHQLATLLRVRESLDQVRDGVRCAASPPSFKQTPAFRCRGCHGNGVDRDPDV
jgi:hypothetical protein